MFERVCVCECVRVCMCVCLLVCVREFVYLLSAGVFVYLTVSDFLQQDQFGLL